MKKSKIYAVIEFLPCSWEPNLRRVLGVFSDHETAEDYAEYQALLGTETIVAPIAREEIIETDSGWLIH